MFPLNAMLWDFITANKKKNVTPESQASAVSDVFLKGFNLPEV